MATKYYREIGKRNIMGTDWPIYLTVHKGRTQWILSRLCNGSCDRWAKAFNTRKEAVAYGNAYQVVTPEFAEWLDSTSFSGVVNPGDQWDSEDAWPTPASMASARRCYTLFDAGEFGNARDAMVEAQQAFV